MFLVSRMKISLEYFSCHWHVITQPFLVSHYGSGGAWHWLEACVPSMPVTFSCSSFSCAFLLWFWNRVLAPFWCSHVAQGDPWPLCWCAWSDLDRGEFLHTSEWQLWEHLSRQESERAGTSISSFEDGREENFKKLDQQKWCKAICSSFNAISILRVL